MNGQAELYLPNRKTLQALYVPPEIELPKGDARCQVYDYQNVNPTAVAELSWTFDRPTVIWGITGMIAQQAAPGALLANGFRFQVAQTHIDSTTGEVTTFNWFNKHQVSQNIAGTGALPFLLRQPMIVGAGDALQVEVKSLVPPTTGLNAGTIARIQLCLFGVIPDLAVKQ